VEDLSSGGYAISSTIYNLGPEQPIPASVTQGRLAGVLWHVRFCVAGHSGEGLRGIAVVASFAPFENRRYFLLWRPIHVSPIGIGRFFSERGVAVVESELLWIWLPATLLALSVWLMRAGELRLPRSSERHPCFEAQKH